MDIDKAIEGRAAKAANLSGEAADSDHGWLVKEVEYWARLAQDLETERSS